MKKTITLSISNPCHQDWSAFQKTSNGGFCESCQKEVIDFTTWTNDRIAAYFKAERPGTCGRFERQQLKSYETGAAVKKSRHWLSAFLFTVTMLVLGRHATAQQARRLITETLLDEKQDDRQPPAAKSDSIHITGIVKDGTGDPLPGTNVFLKGGAIGTVTNVEGKFEILVPANMHSFILTFSFIGYETQEVRINSARELMISMKHPVEMIAAIAGGTSVARFTPRGLWWKVKNLFR